MKTLLLSLITVLALNSYAQNVNIPDANFKAYLVGNALINTNADTEIQVSEANVFNGSIAISTIAISDLTGIEEFTALTILACWNLQLTSLDVTQNSALTILNCSGNQLTSIDVTQNTALTYLDCSSNQLTSLSVSNNTALSGLYCRLNELTSLDVTQNTTLEILDCTENALTSIDVTGITALTQLKCDGNLLTSLDVSNNTALTELWCQGNKLTSLDVTQNTVLARLNCSWNLLQCLNVKNGNNANSTYFNATSNANLTCIEVDDVTWSNANWTIGANIDPQTSFSTSCANPCALGITDLTNTPKELLKIVDLMGRETPYKPNTVLIYVFDDGTTEKVFKMEE